MVTQLLSGSVYTPPTDTDYLLSAPLHASPWPSGYSFWASCSFLASGASVPINRGLLCAVTSACLVYCAASLIFAASLPHGCSYLEALAVSIASAASWILSVQAFCYFVDLTDSGLCLMVSVPLGYCYIVAPIASWLLCPFGPLSCCFMASATCGPTFSHASWFLQLSPCFCSSVSDIPHPPPRLPC